MSGLALAANLLLPGSPVRHNLASLGDTFGFGCLVRHRDRQQEIDRNPKYASKLLMQRDRALALSCLEIGQVALGDADRDRELGLCLSAPVAQDANRIFAGGKPINDGLGQQDFRSGGDGTACLSHNSCRPGILAASQRGESLVFTFRQDSEFLAFCRSDELDLGHRGLSIVDLASMSDGSDDQRLALDVEDHAPVANAQPRSRTALEPLHVSLTGLGKSLQFGFDPSPNVGGKIEPLPRGRAGERDLHKLYIADRDTVRKHIAECDGAVRP